MKDELTFEHIHVLELRLQLFLRLGDSLFKLSVEFMLNLLKLLLDVLLILSAEGWQVERPHDCGGRRLPLLEELFVCFLFEVKH